MCIRDRYIFGKNAFPGFVSDSVKTTTTSTKMLNDTLRITNTTKWSTQSAPAMTKNFSGFYVYLIKNIGKHHQVALRYDYFDPNTKLTGKQIGQLKGDTVGHQGMYSYEPDFATGSTKTITGKPTVTTSGNNITTDVTNYTYSRKLASGTSDIAYGTIGIAYTYFLTENIKLSIEYDMPMNEKVGTSYNTKTKSQVSNVMGPAVNVNGTNVSSDYSTKFSQNTLTIRLQAKF